MSVASTGKPQAANRTPLLLGAMALVVIVWVGDQFGLLSFIDNWGKSQAATLAKLSRDIETAESVVLAGADAADKLDAYADRSLPTDIGIARSKYQAWWSGILQLHQFQQSSAEVSLPTAVAVKDGKKKTEAYKRYAFTIGGIANLDQITALLLDFYQAGHLHKIHQLSLSPTSGARFNVSLSGEALGVANCERETELSTSGSGRLAGRDLASYATVVRRNIFSQQAGSALKQVLLSSITFDKSGRPEAWFKVGVQRTTKKLLRGESFTVSTHVVEILDIHPRSVLLLIDDNVREVALGKSLHDVLSKEAS